MSCDKSMFQRGLFRRSLMISMGLDISTKTGLVILETEDPITKGMKNGVVIRDMLEINFPKTTGMFRARMIAGAVVSKLQKIPPDVIMIEGYGFANRNTLALLVEIGTIIRHILWQEDFTYNVITPNGLKKFISGKGNAAKDYMRLETYKRWGFEHSSDNVVDAFGLAMVGLAVKNMMKLDLKQRQAIGGVSMDVGRSGN